MADREHVAFIWMRPVDQSRFTGDNRTMTRSTDATLGRAYLDTVKRLVTNYAYLGGADSLRDFNALHHYDAANSAWTIDPLSRPLPLLTDDQLDLIETIVPDLAARQVPGDCPRVGLSSLTIGIWSLARWRWACIATGMASTIRSGSAPGMHIG